MRTLIGKSAHAAALVLMSSVAASAATPVITVPGSQTVREGAHLQFSVSCTDADGDDIRFFLRSLQPFPVSNPSLFALFPTLSGIGPLLGVFQWTPGSADAGAYTAFFQCEDATTSATELVGITVTDVPPVAVHKSTWSNLKVLFKTP